MKIKYAVVIVFLLLQSLSAQEFLWYEVFSGDGSMSEYAYDVAIDDDCNVYVTGRTSWSFNYAGYNTTTIKYDKHGTIMWDNTLTIFNDRDVGESICHDTDGNAYVAGYARSGIGRDLVVIKYDGNSGDTIWITTREQNQFTGAEYSYKIAVDDSGDVYVATRKVNDFWLAKFNGVDGDMIWEHVWDPDTLNSGQVWRDMVLDNAGNIFVAGTQVFFSNERLYTAKYEPDGYQQWYDVYYESTWTEGCDGIDIDDDGNVYVSGTSRFGTFQSHPIVLKYGTYGTRMWCYHHETPNVSTNRDIKVYRPTGESYITGNTVQSGGDWNVLTVALDANGNFFWEDEYDSPSHSNDCGYELGVTDNCVYVGGFSGSNILTLCYARDGSQRRWDEIFDNGLSSNIAVKATNLSTYIVRAGKNRADPDDWITLMYRYSVTDDSLALAYNGNRHLVRKPNSEELHLVYTSEDKVIYVTSTNGGTDWSEPEIIGEGKYPAIALDADHLPSVTWTDDNGGLWYGKENASSEWDVYHLYNPIGFDPRLNSPPSIAIHASNPNTVHILVTRSGGIPGNGVEHKVEDYSFPITQPGQGAFELIEQCMGPPDPPLRSFPSITKCDVDNSLHGVWQRSDTICYATKPKHQCWNNWGPQFLQQGRQSAHPFVETYGDMIYVAWQHLEPPRMKEDVYKAERHLSELEFTWYNLSLTPETKSLYSVNASGFFTVFNDEIEPPVDSRYEVFYKIEPDDPLTNISQTEAKSIYPQSAARFFPRYKYLYTTWLDGNESPYEIRFKKIRYEEPAGTLDVAYLSSPNGHNPSSPYLIARDSCISDWQIPVDIGYETITYQFPLVPGYRYKLKAVAYHEREDKWKTKVMIDNEEVAEIEYEAYEPETSECWIPSEFYADSVIEVIFECDDGDFASVGPVFIYQYEYEEGEGGFPGGPMTQENQSINKCSFMITPNPFTQGLTIKFQNQTEKGINIKVYDVSGRLVKSLYRGIVNSNHTLIWSGYDDYGRIAAQGIYFLQIQNLNTDEIYVHKVIKIE